jgi:hypothetical protein
MLAAWAGLCTFFNASALAGEPIDADGPDFVESSEVVPPGRFQYELDAVHSGGSHDGAISPTSNTPLLLKYGIAPNFELRLATDGVTWQDRHTGVGDVALGFKWHVNDSDRLSNSPAVAWLFHFDLPTGSAEFRGRGIRPSVRSVINWDLSDDYALSLMPGAGAQSSDSGQRFPYGIFGAVLSRKLAERARVFVELALPQIAASRYGGTIGGVDLGGAYLLSDDIQLGARAGWAINQNSPRNYILFEIAQRF